MAESASASARKRGLTAEAAEHAEGEERRGIQHKGTRVQRTQSSEKIELRFISGEWPIPFFRALALSLALDRREERRGRGRRIQHKGTRAQSSEKIELRFRSGEWPIPFFRARALSLVLDRREERRGI